MEVKRANGHHRGDRVHPRVVDFASWQHESLARFAQDAYDRIQELEADLRTAIDAYRELVRRKQ
jgi:hypothetical protein